MSCKRCGECCSHFYLKYAPDELLAEYKLWMALKRPKDGYITDIHLVAPMVRLIRVRKDGQYVYRCAHLQWDEHGRAICGIWKIRPRLCRDFPKYGKKRMTGEQLDTHRKNFPKCRYFETRA